MSILKLDNWLDEVDPYGIKQLTLYKSCFIATILVFTYWISRPAVFNAYFVPVLMMPFYELPVLKSFQDRNRLLLFIFIVMPLGGISFYLLFPFKFFFLFYAIIFFLTSYYIVGKFFPQLKALTMLLVVNSAIETSLYPEANLQIAYNIFFSGALSMTVIFVCLKIFPNRYFQVWSKAMQNFIGCLENEIESSILGLDKKAQLDEVRHINMARLYQRFIPTEYLMNVHRLSVSIRNIQFALDNVYDKDKNEVFWYTVKNELSNFKGAMKDGRAISQGFYFEVETILQRHVADYLNRAVKSWNVLCARR